ncbi:phage portal protein [Amycolatopsis kentuckyensis]|uniref:phage portal protein n=1 Tax=Amycolatopsis kentuckyensis TaxID=218823 RepID=UPI00356658E9
MLIAEGSAWPPPQNYYDTMRHRWESWSAWWSGDLHRLRTTAAHTAPGGYWARHAAKSGKGEIRQMHMPLAADIARTSAELIFGDSPRLDWGDKSTAVTDAWETMADEIGWTNTLLEGAETAAALGGVYLRPLWDQKLSDRPILTVVRDDDAIPVFRFGRLAEVTFVTVLNDDPHNTLRWLEHHEPGQIRHELWLGSSTNVGRAVPLTEHPVTAGLSGEPVNTKAIRGSELLVDYVPNDLPQPLVHTPHGRSDLQGLETDLDALDEVWDSWIRDIRLGKGRILASAEMLEPVSTTGGVARQLFGKLVRGGREKGFDVDAEAFTPLPGMPGDDAGKPSPITVAQFALRVQEHADTANELVDNIVSRAGYAPQTFGRHVEGQLSGTAMSRRERRSNSTQGRKRQYWKPGTRRAAETLMLIRAHVFGGPKPDGRPALEWPVDQADPKEAAETINLLAQAEAVSTEIKVKMAHPEWEQRDVDDEVKRIKAEKPAAPDPLTGGEPFGPPDHGQQQPPGSGEPAQ